MDRYRKICVYAMAGNEAKFIDKWMESMLEADYITCLVTKSEDGTLERFKEYEKQYPGKVIIDYEEITPWRFDSARNESMKLIPEDAEILVCTDLDELLDLGWAEPLREAWTDQTRRASYWYAWSSDDNGNPLRVFHYNKIHNKGWIWKFPVHETLWDPVNDTADYNWTESIDLFDKVRLRHFPDRTKSRGSYLPLLELRKQESPEDAMGRIYLANEYVYRGMPDKALNEFQEILDTFDYGPIEKAACRRFMAECNIKLGQTIEAIANYHRAIEIDPLYREAYLGLGQLYLTLKLYDMAVGVLEQGLKKSVRRYSWHELDTSWSYEPYDLLCQAYYWAGNYEKSVINGIKALKYKPQDERLKNNLELCMKKV